MWQAVCLPLDTCVWNALLLENYHREDNLFEELCYWIENRHLIHIVPDNIIDEWDRNKENVKKLTVDFLNQQKLSIKKNSELSSTYDSSVIPNLVQKRMNRIDSILKTFSEPALQNDSILIDSAKRSLKTLAPNHIKDSLRDTVNILTLIDYLKTNDYKNSYFLTSNYTDFSANKENRSILHEQLTELFSQANLTYTYVVEGKDLGMLFFHNLRKDLPNFTKYLIENRKSKIENEKPINEYLDTIKYIDLILSKKEPKIIDKDLIKSFIIKHDSYKTYFFKNVENIFWFDFLKEEGYFSPDLNPISIETSKGVQFAFWESLYYLEKVSAQIKKGNHKNYLPDIISIINDVSIFPRNNEYTWYSFLNILINLPNESIPIEIINFIPIWLHGNDDTSLLSSNLCSKLLPKFLNDMQSKDDTEKVEVLLEHLFTFEKKEIIKGGIYDSRNSSYKSRVSLHFLVDVFVKKDLTSKIVANCSDKIILNLGINLKKLLIDYPFGLYLFIDIGDTDYELKILIDDIHLIVKCLKCDNEKSKNDIVIPNYEELDESQTKDKLIEALIEMGINYEPSDQNEKNIGNLILCLKNDLNFSFGFSTPIYKLGDGYLDDDKILEIYSLIFRELLNAKAVHNTNDALKLLNTICYDKSYRLPFYKRVTLYVIGENWKELKSLFWELVKENDVEQFFSKREYFKDLLYLLKKNQQSLNADEKRILQTIIENGEQGNLDTSDKQNEYWQLGWFSALKGIVPFKEKYEYYSKKLNTTSDHFDNLGEFQYCSGSIPPISVEDISMMSNNEIVDYLHSYRAIRDFGKPSISGLSEVFEKAIIENPQKYSEEIDLYKNIFYVYSYHMFYAFTKSWENIKCFSWHKVLLFCRNYIKNENFYSGNLKINDDGLNVNSDWVVGSIGNLITSGLEDEKHSLDLDLLPLVKEILELLVLNLSFSSDEPTKYGNNYTNYLYNSTAGKVLRALLNYSLCVARNNFKKEEKQKWNQEIKALFEITIGKKIIDVFILQGMFYRQFYYLDKIWIKRQIKNNYQLEDKYWLAFINGFAFASPPSNKTLYNSFYPHYERAIDRDIQIKQFNNPGIIRHLVAFYFWGYEELKSEGLIYKFLIQSKPEDISEMINYIWQQEEYITSLKYKERIKFEKIIFDLWKYLTIKFENAKKEEEQILLGDLIKFIVFIPELNEEVTSLILKSSNQINKRFLSNELIENLISLMSKGQPLLTAMFIGQILNAISFNNYISDREKEPLIVLVTFLYQNYQKEEADKFCNKLSMLETGFLKELYYANNPD